MTYAIEHYCLRTVGPDDAEALHHYERVNRDFLRPWEPERDEHYFTLSNARARVEQQLESMVAGRSVCFVLVDPKRGEMLGRCNYTHIIGGAFQAGYLGFSLAQAVQGQGLMKDHWKQATVIVLSKSGSTGSWQIISRATSAASVCWPLWGLKGRVRPSLSEDRRRVGRPRIASADEPARQQRLIAG
jgi:hypothetical protein